MPERLEHRRDEPLEARLLAFLESRRAEIPGAAGERFEVGFFKKGYLSTMYRVVAGGASWLLALKHYDGAAGRVQRELEVLAALDGRGAPRAILAEPAGLDGGAIDPLLMTELVGEEQPLGRDPRSLEELAAFIAGIHADARLRALAVDREAPARYSLGREFAEEAAVVDRFAPSVLVERVRAMRALVAPRVPDWEPLFSDGPLVYIHGDLPHSHLFREPAGLRAIHWEFSRRSHPARELGRALANLALPPDGEAHFLSLYRDKAGMRVDDRAIRIQQLLQYFYECIHVAFWLDQSGYRATPSRLRTAEEMAALVHLGLRKSLEDGDLSVAPPGEH